MIFSAADYLTQLRSLLPRGLAWACEVGSTRYQLLRGLAAEFARVDARLVDLRNEADPRTTIEMLPDWEAFVGLPDTCGGVEVSTIESRRAALQDKLLATGGASRKYFIDLAARLGYPGATIDEFRPMSCNGGCNDSLWSVADRFVWKMNLPVAGGIWTMTCNDGCNDYLRVGNGEYSIECRIARLKPAHTVLIFSYVD